MSQSTRENPIDELQRRLTMAKGARAELAAYVRYLPEIVGRNPAEAITFAHGAERAATTLQDWGTLVEIIHHRAHAYLLLNTPAKALDDLKFALDYTDDGAPGPRVRTLIGIGEAAMLTDDPVSALKPLQDALALCGEASPSLRADALQALAELHLSTGHYDKAVAFLRDALVTRKKMNELEGIGQILCAIGTAFGKMKDLSTAYQYHRQSLDAFRAVGDVTNEIRALANLASIHRMRGELNDAFDLIWKAHAACETYEDRITLASLTITIADLHMQQGEPDLALDYYLKAYNSLQKHPVDDILLGLYHRIGRIHEDANDLDAALHVYRLAINIATEVGERQECSDLHRAMSGVLEKLGYFQDALRHYKHYAELQLELADEEQKKKIAEITLRSDMEEMGRELEQTRNRERELRESLEEQSRELTEARIDLTGEKNKVREISKLADKKADAGDDSDLADQIRKTLGKHPDAEETPEDDATAALKRELEREWERLRAQLDRTYPGFIERLLELCPTLTTTEVRICALTKLLKGEPKEIAKILNNTVRTLQTQRLRIRKKLNLDGEVNFATFIDAL